MMFKKFPLLLVIFLLFSCSEKSTTPENQTILEKLQEIPGTTIQTISTPYEYSSAYQIDITQPVDHDNPGGAQFTQRFYLSHKSESAPMVFVTTGYGATGNIIYELADLLQANQIIVGHRFMEGAKIVPVDWQYLTIRQASADYHRIIEYLKPIYGSKWISRGASKGGMTALFHKRFHPEDIDVVIAKVAPLPLSPEDSRFDDFMTNDISTPECRTKMRSFQREVLERKDEIVPFFEDYINQAGKPFIMDAEMMLEYCILEYPIAYWQYVPWECDYIPDSGSTASNIFQNLNSVNGLDYYSEDYNEYYHPIFYQAMTQIGYYGFVTDHLDDLLTTDDHYSNEVFAPQDVDLTFEPAVMQDIVTWLQNDGDSIIYIYGGRDPWSAAAIDLYGEAIAIKIVQPDANHRLTIAGLYQAQVIYDSLESWLDIEITRPVLPTKQSKNQESESVGRPY
jgi:PS-10 peptidase S37